MKKAQAALGIILILVILLGCFDKANADQETETEGISTEIIWPIQIENKSNVLKKDTIYDEEGYYIVIPKGVETTKLSNGNIWTINTNRYLIQFQIFKLSDTFNTETFKTAPVLLNTVKKAIESYSNNTMQLSNDYKTMQIDGKNAILVCGTVKRNNLVGDINVYLIDSKNGLIFLSVVKIQNEGDIASKISMETTAIGVLNTLKIK